MAADDPFETSESEPGSEEPLLEDTFEENTYEEDENAAAVIAAAEDLLDRTSEPEAEFDELAAVSAERDEYLATARQVQADFENFRKRSLKQQEEGIVSATGRLAESLLPALDACDAAVLHGVEGIGSVHKVLLESLAKAGLEVVPTEDVPFDPNIHEAVMHEAGDGGGPVITEVLRTGYLWRGRTLRAAMVKVRD